MRFACLLFVAVLVVLAGCSVFKEGSVAGSVESKGEAGNWTLTTGKCSSGQRENYFGVVGYGPDGSGIAIKLVKDSVKGWQAVINQAESCKGTAKSDCKAIVLTASTCTKFDVDINNTSLTVNDIKVVEGKATFDCASGGDSLKGSLTFTHCH